MNKPDTRQVRAFNVRVGDEMSWYDTQLHREATMVVAGVEVRESSPFPIHLTLNRKSAKRKQRYLISFKRHQLLRVRRYQ